jgi:hypothetical protein
MAFNLNKNDELIQQEIYQKNQNLIYQKVILKLLHRL